MGEFDDLIPSNSGGGEFDDLIPSSPQSVKQPSIPFTETGKLRLSDIISPRLGSSLLGTPEGQTAGQQFKQMYDRSQDSGNVPYAVRYANSAATGIAGDAVDIALNPSSYLAGPAIKLGAKAIGAGSKAIGKGIGSFFAKTPEELKFALLNKQRGITNDAIPHISSQTLPKLKESIEKWIPKLSEEYGARYRPLIDGAKVNSKKLIDVLTKAAKESDLVDEYGNLFGKIEDYSPEAQSFLKYIDDLKGKSADNIITSPILTKGGEPFTSVSKGVTEFDVSKVDDFLKSFLQKNVGQQYGAGQRILTNSRKAFNEILNDVPGLKALKEEFAPQLQMKTEMFRKFKPFSRETETAGRNFLSGLAKGKGSLEQEKIIVDFLKQKFPGILDEIEGVGSQLSSTKNQVANLSGKIIRDRAFNQKLGTAAKYGAVAGIPTALASFLFRKK